MVAAGVSFFSGTTGYSTFFEPIAHLPPESTGFLSGFCSFYYLIPSNFSKTF